MDSTIQLTLSLDHIHLLLRAVGYLPPSPDAITIEQLLQAALSAVGNTLPLTRSSLPISTFTLDDDVCMAPSDAEIDRELLTLIGDDSDIEQPVSADAGTQESDQEVDFVMADSNRETDRGLLTPLGEESESPDGPSLSPDGALAVNHPQPQPRCPRGGKKLRKQKAVTVCADPTVAPVAVEVPTPGSQFIPAPNTAPSGNHTAYSLIASLAGACIDKATIWAEELKHNLVEWQHTGDSLPSIVRRCQNTTCSNLSIILGHVQLVIKCQSLIESTAFKDLNDIFIKRIQQLPNPPAQATFYRWVHIGHKFSHLANGGSFYILILISALDLRTAVARLEAQVPWEIGKMLREPETCRTPNLIKVHIIPILERLRQLVPIVMGPDVFCSDFIKHYNLPVNLDCTDLLVNDKFFGNIKHQYFALPERDGKAWLTWIESPVTRDHLIVGNALPHNNHTQTRVSFKIETKFDRSHKENERHPNGHALGVANIEWTQCERRLALQAPTVLNLYQLREKLDCFYPGGFKAQGSYLHVPVRQMPPQTFEIRNSDGTLMVFVSSEMPSHLKKTLAESFIGVFDGDTILVGRNTSEEPAKQFECVHYAIYNRYALKGTNAPPELHPHRLQLHNKRTNYTQMVPYASAETFEHRDRYHKFLEAFDNTFVWVSQLMEDHLPDDYQVLMALSHSLPGGYEAPVSPFLSLVVNLNIRSEAHRDSMDKNVCLVIPIGDFKGGELVLVEQGLVLELGSGDVAVFRSGEATHFNQDYEGERASFVLHTDRHMDMWKEHHNYWDGNHYFN